MAQYFGRATISYDGKKLDSMPKASIDLGGVVKKPVKTAFNIGYQEELEPGVVECEVAVSKDTALDEMKQIVGATVTFQMDTGQTYMVRNAFVEGSTKLDDGKMKLKLTGAPAEKV
jgi:hypothetical protein